MYQYNVDEKEKEWVNLCDIGYEHKTGDVSAQEI